MLRLFALILILSISGLLAVPKRRDDDPNPLHIRLTYSRNRILVAPITIGTPDQSLNLLVDSTGADSIVFDQDCLRDDGTKCSNDQEQNYTRTLYSPSQSTTSKSLGFGWKYGDDWLSANCDAFSDSITFADFPIGMAFGSAKKLTGDWTKVIADGVLGLGLPGSNNLGASIIKNLTSTYPSNTQNPNIVTLWLDDFGQLSKGYLTIGDYDSRNCFLDDLVNVSLTSGVAWEFQIQGWNYGNQSAKGSITRLDTTSRSILFPRAQLAVIAQAVGAIYDNEIQGYYIPCENAVFLPDFFLTIGNKQFNIPYVEYVESFKSSDRCELLFNENTIWEQTRFGPQVRLGHPFMRAYCTIFDYATPAISFSKAHHFQ
ncbi:unnamed protein product, partial [Mesorhabditis belari]|uniref:Peptidase A1 domain-containing protein n=1 Tax=Mesorhabditis belari TaxID=2138241 RepID=A0AAF3EDY2_9BILA